MTLLKFHNDTVIKLSVELYQDKDKYVVIKGVKYDTQSGILPVERYKTNNYLSALVAFCNFVESV